MYAIETNKKTDDLINVADWTNYQKKGTHLYLTGKDILGNSYGPKNCGRYPLRAGRDENRALRRNQRGVLVTL